jgi:hypothetical protein
MSKLRNILEQIQNFRSDLGDVRGPEASKIYLLFAIEYLMSAAIDIDEKTGRFKNFDMYHKEKIGKAKSSISDACFSGDQFHVEDQNQDEIRGDITKAYWLLYDREHNDVRSGPEVDEAYSFLSKWIDYDYLVELKNGIRT